ncbi:MAG: hypothetical protein ACRDLP_00880, partial [Solirubrobacteraceae bacterium]
MYTALAPTVMRRLQMVFARDTWLRRCVWTVPTAGFLFATAAFFGWLAVWFPIVGHNQQHNTTGTTVFEAVFMVAMAAVFATVAIRVMRAGLLIALDGVSIRGVLKSRLISVSQVDRFALGPASAKMACPWLYRTHGRPLPVAALSVSFGAGSQRAQPLCDELNTVLAAVKAASPAHVAVDPEVAAHAVARETRPIVAAVIFADVA